MPGDGQRQRAQRDSGAGHGDSGGGGTGSGDLRAGRWNHRGRGWRAGHGLDFARCGPGRGAGRPPPDVAGRAPRRGIGAAQTRRHARRPPHPGLRQHQRRRRSRGSRGLRRRGCGCAAHGVSVPRPRGRARRRGTTGRLSRHRRVAGGASTDHPRARYRRRQESALRGDRRGSQPIPRLARHPRDVEPARPVPNAAPRHPPGRRRAASRVAVADDRFARRAARDQSPGWRSRGRAGTRRVAFPQEHPHRRHDRSARGRGHRRSVGARGRLLQHRQQRSDPVRHGRRPHQLPRGAHGRSLSSPPYCA